MNSTKMGLFEAIFFVLTVTTNKIILNLPKYIIVKCGSSAWINIIYISIIMLFFVLITIKLFKKFEGNDILDISNYLGGKGLKSFCGIGYIFSYILVSFLVLRDFSETLITIYYSNSPLIFIMLFIIIGMLLGNKFGFKAIIKTNLYIMPIVIFSILVMFFSSLKNFEFQSLFPILGNGANATFFSGFSNIFAFSGLGYLFLIMPYLNNCKQFKKISITCIIISSIYLLLSVLCLLLVLPYIAVTDETNSIYLLTRTLEFGRFFQRIDALFILLFIMSCLSYLTITLFLILDIFKKITNIKDSKAMSYCFSTLILGLALIPDNISIIRNINYTVLKDFILYFIFGFSTIVLILANIKKKKKENINISKQL